MNESYVSHDAPFSESVARFREGRDSPRAYLERCIERIEAHDGTIKAFAHHDLSAARRAADESTRRYKEGRPLSPIDGMPIGVKDIIDTAGMPTQMNNEIYRGHVPRCDAACSGSRGMCRNPPRKRWPRCAARCIRQ